MLGGCRDDREPRLKVAGIVMVPVMPEEQRKAAQEDVEQEDAEEISEDDLEGVTGGGGGNTESARIDEGGNLGAICNCEKEECACVTC